MYNGILKLKKNKSGGIDDINAKHYKCLFLHACMHVHISVLFSAMLKYSYIPNRMINILISPIIKNKCGNLSSKENYRLLLNRFKNYLSTNDNQFAFKENLFTDIFIFSAKQVIYSYISKYTQIFQLFLI